MSRTAAAAAYGCLSLAYVAGIFWASALPRVSMTGDPAGPFAIVTNFFHLPLYAALSFFITMSLCGGRREDASLRTLLTVLLAGSLCAALDEWHQSFVPGRSAAVSDFLLDVTGVSGMLFLLSIESRWEVRS